MRDPRDIVDISGVSTGPGTGHANAGSSGASGVGARAWLGIWFRCCHVYGRLYKNASGRMYVGRCPKCGAEAKARVGSGGTNRRLFEAH